MIEWFIMTSWSPYIIGAGIMEIGARWAGGCTSGHGISGTLQLSVGSWIAVICFFAAGIVVAGLIYGFSFIGGH